MEIWLEISLSWCTFPRMSSCTLNLVERNICGDKGFDQINIEDIVRAGVHGGKGEELLSYLLSLNIEPHVVLVPKRLHMLLKDAFAVHFGTEAAELTNQMLGFRHITPKLSVTKFFDKNCWVQNLGHVVSRAI